MLDGAWWVTRIGDEDVPDGPHRAELVFEPGVADQGEVFGSTGVNRLRGTYALQDATLTFGPLATTLMAGPEDRMAQEFALLTAFGEPLTVTDPAGSDAAEGPGASTTGSPERRVLVTADGRQIELVRQDPAPESQAALESHSAG